MNTSSPFFHDISILLKTVSPPAFIYAEKTLIESLLILHKVSKTSNCKNLFSIKPLAFFSVLTKIAQYVQDFSVSSLFEAKLARFVSGEHGKVHLITPGLKQAELYEISRTCDFVSFNSLSQWSRFKGLVTGKLECGLRINPQISLIKDERYDPCRRYSKLGVPLKHFSEIVNRNSNILNGINGLHFHTNCDSSDFSQLLSTVKHFDENLSDLLYRVEWINIGGGYLFDEAETLDPFYQAVELLKSKYRLEVFIEPGAAIVRKAGFLVSSVLDLFESDGKTIAILDTTVNHMPEVFEYQFEPDVMDHVDGGRYEYILAGCSCLAGDVFGEYAFDQPLEIGSRIIFTNMGAYTLVKAHMFNGINLPTIYAMTESGELVLKKQFTYADFASRNGVEDYAHIRERDYAFSGP